MSINMLCLCLFSAFLLTACYAERSVSFPDEPQKNGTIQSRFGWSALGDYLKALDAIFNGYYGARIQTPSAEIIPAPTEDYSTPSPTSPPFSIAPEPNPVTLPQPTGIVPIFEPIPAPSEPEDVVIEAATCECLPLELCTNTTSRDATTRIVTRPPPGVVCGAGEVYCCVETAKLGCGIQNIIPGVIPSEGQANLGEFPWSAVILTSDYVYVGGGILIDSTHVLTAAHKVARYGNGAGLRIRLGEWDLSNEDEPVEFLEVGISRIVNHPRFEATTLRNDISIITLASPVTTLTRPYPQINTLCLPEATSTFTGSRCMVAGWGKDRFNGQYQNIIKKVEVPVLSHADCQMKLRNTRLGSSYVLDTNSFICAGGELSRDACTGDGGSALACQRNGQYYLVGITAGGIECGNENVPGLYVNMVNYLTWVNSQIQGNNVIDPRRRPT